jgi:hypothetical protein
MSKTSVTRIFLGSTLAVVAAVFIAFAAIVAALASGSVEFGGPEVVTVHDGFGASLLWLLAATVLFIAGSIGTVVAWVGALLNTGQLEDKTWFVVLLVLGLFSFGWLATAAYVVAGPDSSAHQRAYPGSAPAASG